MTSTATISKFPFTLHAAIAAVVDADASNNNDDNDAGFLQSERRHT